MGKCEVCGTILQQLTACEAEWTEPDPADMPEGEVLRVKVKRYEDVVRPNGNVQKEVAEVLLSVPDFLAHIARCLELAFKQKWEDVMTAQALRHTTNNLDYSTVKCAGDFAAVHDIHPQDNQNQAILLHCGQLILLMQVREGFPDGTSVIRTFDHHYWYGMGGTLQSDNHFVRNCIADALHRLQKRQEEKNLQFPENRNEFPKKLLLVTDGDKKQFKSCKGAVALKEICQQFQLSAGTHVTPPTSTHKGDHDSAGHVDKRYMNTIEKREIARCTTMREMITVLWRDAHKPGLKADPPSPSSKHRGMADVDERIRVLVVDRSDSFQAGDDDNPNILVLDRKNQLFEGIKQPGIAGRYFQCFLNPLMPNIEGEVQRFIVRDMVCPCPPCLRMKFGGLAEECIYLTTFGQVKDVKCGRLPDVPEVPKVRRLASYNATLNRPGTPLQAGEVILVAVRGGGGLRRVVQLPTKLLKKMTRTVRQITRTFEAGSIVLEARPLRQDIVNDIAGDRVFCDDIGVSVHTFLKLDDVVLPPTAFPGAHGQVDRGSCLPCVVQRSGDGIAGRTTYTVSAGIMDVLDAEEERIRETE